MIIKVFCILLFTIFLSMHFFGVNNKDSISDKTLKSKDDILGVLSQIDDIQQKIDGFKKDLKIENINEANKIKNELIDIKKTIDFFDKTYNQFFNILKAEEQKLIQDQKVYIYKSFSILQKIVNGMNKDFGKISREDFFDRSKDAEKEIKNINRQFRAIKWILSEN